MHLPLLFLQNLNIQPKTTSGLPMSLSKAVKCVLISCHAISVCLYLVRAQAIYNFALHSQGICSSIEFCDTLYCEFRVDRSLLSGKNVTCTPVFILQSDCYHQMQAPKVDNFSHECSQALSSLCFRGDSLETRSYLMQWQLMNSGPDTPLTLP